MSASFFCQKRLLRSPTLTYCIMMTSHFSRNPWINKPQNIFGYWQAGHVILQHKGRLRDMPKERYRWIILFFFFFFSGFDAHRRKLRSEVNSRPLFDSKGKSDAKRQKVKGLLVKRKQMQFSHFASPPKTNSDLSKLGIKVRRSRSKDNEDSDKGPDKGPSDEGAALTGVLNLSQTRASTVLDSHSGLDRKEASDLEYCAGTDPNVTSQSETPVETANQGERISSSISVSHAKENRKSGIEISTTLNTNSSVRSLVCCDYADSSDASDDLTWSIPVLDTKKEALTNISMFCSRNSPIGVPHVRTSYSHSLHGILRNKSCDHCLQIVFIYTFIIPLLKISVAL